MSYQTTNEDILAAFTTAKTHLKEGGIFIFDCWYGPAMLTEQPSVRIKRLEDEAIRVTRIAEPVMYLNENIVDVNYHVFIKYKEGGKVDEIKESHRMRYLFKPEIDLMLRTAGLKLIYCGEWMNGKEPGFGTWGGGGQRHECLTESSIDLKQKPQIAMVCYCYSFEVAPTLKNICSYFYEKDWGSVDVYVDKLYLSTGFRYVGANIIVESTSISSVFRSFVSRSTSNKKKRLFEKYLKKKMSNYQFVIAADYTALDILKNIGYDLSKVVYVSLEGIDYLKYYNKACAIQLLSDCLMRIVQSNERGQDINQYFGSDLTFEYLPVSCRPFPIKSKEQQIDGNVKMVYSGYFADWACLLEFIEAYKKIGLKKMPSFLLQGHSMSTNDYLSRVKDSVKGISEINIDTSFYHNEMEHNDLLSKHDIGIVFYKDISGSRNFENLIYSSGKVSSYLWNGLAVMTNIKAKETKKPPFIYVDNFNTDQIKNGIELVKANRELFMQSAYQVAHSRYNFDSYFEKFVDKLKR